MREVEAPAVLVPVAHAYVEEVLITEASEELFPSEYSTQLWLIVPAPLFVAGNERPIARSTSVKFNCWGI